MSKSLTAAVLATLSLMAGSSAMADETPWLVRVRTVHLDTAEQAKAISIDIDQDRARSLGVTTQNVSRVISAAVNAQVDLAIARGTTAQEIALQFGKVHVFVNVLGDTSSEVGDLTGAATAGIAL